MLNYHIIPVTAFEQNATVLWCSETLECAVSDPGGDLPKILAFIDERGLTLKQILLTHGHLDHAGGALGLSQTTQPALPIIGPHPEDQFWLDGISAQGKSYGFPPPCDSFTISHPLYEGDTVAVGHETLQVFHCPGHTPGHVIFYHAASKLAVVGDVIFDGSIGRSDFPRGDFDTLVHSIRHKLFPLGNEVQFIPGHGPMSTFGAQRARNPYVGDEATTRRQ